MKNVCEIPNISLKETFIKEKLNERLQQFKNYKGEKSFIESLKQENFLVNLQKEYRRDKEDELQAYVVKAVTENWLSENGIKDNIEDILATVRTSCCQHFSMRYGNKDVFNNLSGLYNQTLLKFKQQYVKSFFIDIDLEPEEAYVTNNTTIETRIHNHKKQLVKNILSYSEQYTEENLEVLAETILKNAEEYEKFMDSTNVLDIINKWYPNIGQFSLNTVPKDEDDKYKIEKAKLAYTSLYILENYDQLLKEVSGQKFNFKIGNANYSGIFAIPNQGKYTKGKQEGSSNFTREEMPDAEKNIDLEVKTILQTIPRNNIANSFLNTDDLKILASCVFSYYDKNKDEKKFGNISENPEKIIYEILMDTDFLNDSNSIKFQSCLNSFIEYFRKIQEINTVAYQKNTYLENDIIQKICHELININPIQYITYEDNDPKILYFANRNSKVTDFLKSIEETLYATIKTKNDKESLFKRFDPNSNSKKETIEILLKKISGISDQAIDNFLQTHEENDKEIKNLYETILSILKNAEEKDNTKDIKTIIHKKLLPSESQYNSYDTTNPIYQLAEVLVKDEPETINTQIPGSNNDAKYPTYSFYSPLEDFLRLLTHRGNETFTKNLFKLFPQLLKPSKSSNFKTPFAVALDYTKGKESLEIKELNPSELLVNDFNDNFLKLKKQGLFATRIGENADKGRQVLMMINTKAEINIVGLISESELEEEEVEIIKTKTNKKYNFTLNDATEEQLAVLCYLTQKAYYKELQNNLIDTMSKVIKNQEIKDENEDEYIISQEEYDSIKCETLTITDQLSSELQDLAVLNNDDAIKQCK